MVFYPPFSARSWLPQLLAVRQPPTRVWRARRNRVDLSSIAYPDKSTTFDDPTAAIEAFKATLAANDLDGVARLLGLDAEK